jgi:hypothetical protein
MKKTYPKAGTAKTHRDSDTTKVYSDDSMNLLDRSSFLVFLREHHRTRSASTFRASQLGSSQEHRFPKKRQERLVGPCLRSEFLADTRTIDKEDRAGSIACVKFQEREKIVSFCRNSKEHPRCSTSHQPTAPFDTEHCQ